MVPFSSVFQQRILIDEPLPDVPFCSVRLAFVYHIINEL
jgi:hypothetical protein